MPRDIRLLMQAPQVLPDEGHGRVVVHEGVQHLIVRRATDLVEQQAPESLLLDRDSRCGHAITTIMTITVIILIPNLSVDSSLALVRRVHQYIAGFEAGGCLLPRSLTPARRRG